ncbi:MAG: sigma-54 dependent transcriptional regulator [Planctomycetaceae bacterium]
MIFESSSMQDVLSRARRYAKSSGTVLITGESGTGKELLAQYLHDQSPRAARRCIRVNCAAFHDGLAESELFGHEQGAFTGAARRHDGLLAAAGDGTLFLDEIGELPLPTQAKLLRVLECGEYFRVGSTDLQKVQARIVAATNRDLVQEIKECRFREDLFHRLNVLTLRLAPLRERPEDIEPLVRHFIAQFGAENETPVTDIHEDALKTIRQWAWPGNVRQLRNAIQRACVECDGSVLTAIDPGQENMSTATSALPTDFLTLPLEEIERQIILKRIERFRGNKTEAANALGVTARTLRNKIARWNEIKKAG